RDWRRFGVAALLGRCRGGGVTVVQTRGRVRPGSVVAFAKAESAQELACRPPDLRRHYLLLGRTRRRRTSNEHRGDILLLRHRCRRRPRRRARLWQP
ncbi:unnamed protein product, partial [Ectocarpus sp. 12 AP-2014]